MTSTIGFKGFQKLLWMIINHKTPGSSYLVLPEKLIRDRQLFSIGYNRANLAMDFCITVFRILLHTVMGDRSVFKVFLWAIFTHSSQDSPNLLNLRLLQNMGVVLSSSCISQSSLYV